MHYVSQFIKKQIICVDNEWESHIDNILRLFDSNLNGDTTPENMLDVGCGDGSRTQRLAQYFNIDRKNLYGLDYDQNLINLSNLHFNSSRTDLEVDAIPFKEGMFDLVICNQVLEHLKNYQNVINQIIRVTKIGGYIVLGVPNLAHLINRIYLLFGRQPLCIDIDSSHVRGFTHKSLSLKLSSIKGLELIDIKGSLMYPLPFFIAKLLSKYFISLSGYVCYLLKRV
jgi:2-polyprenyl-3-methyl-5-hydroxy-6-metoxy-1,4-benzoquinol methylase